MKAFLLAAGLGTRLRPLTDETPKCLLPIRGQPLLGIWLESLERHGVEEVLINTHYHSKQVEAFVEGWRDTLKIKLAYEPTLLGSGGTIWTNRDFVKEEKDFFIIYADNLTDANLGDMRDYHQSHEGILTLGLFESSRPEACGVVEIREVGRNNKLVVGFEEKPSNPRGNLSNAGIYVANKRLLDVFPFEQRSSEAALDLGHHILPKLVGNMYAYVIDSLFIDIGTPENYELAQRMWP